MALATFQDLNSHIWPVAIIWSINTVASFINIIIYISTDQPIL